MPFMFPSHQGLAAPLWRRWPRAFDIPAVCVGAAMPDVIDGFAGPLRGHLGQMIGHSLIGLLLCVPVGIALWAGLHALLRRSPRAAGRGFLARCWNRLLDTFVESPGPAQFPHVWPLVASSMAVGTLSHIATDLVSHREFQLLWPWYGNADIWPAWWTVEWWRAPVPLYTNGYSIGPHFAMWMLLNVVGALVLLWPVLRKPAALDG